MSLSIKNGADVFSRGCLLQLSMSVWTAKVKLPSSMIEGVNPEYVSARKNIIDKDCLKALEEVRNEARSYLYSKSLPFPITGVLFIPKNLISTVNERLEGYKGKFNERIEEFCQNYSAYREVAREKLGDLFSESDYPADIRTKFGIKWSFFIMDAPGKTGILSPELYAQAEAHFKQTISDFQETAMMTLRESFAELVGHMVERLSDPTKKFKDTLVGNIREFMDDFKNLNITDDKQLEELVERAKGVLSGDISTQDLRNNMDMRRNVAKQMENVQTVILSSLMDRPTRKLRMAA